MAARRALRAGLTAAATLLMAACARDTGPAPGEIALNDMFRADFTLVDMHGEPATDERFEGKPMLIYYGFTSCPDVCPAAMSVMQSSLDALGGKADRLQPLFITVDPERDTPERLAAYLAFDDRVLGLTGTEEQAKAARDAMKVFASKVALPDSAMAYTVDHQSMFFLTDAAGDPVVAIRDDTPPEDVARIIAKHI